MAKTTAPLLSFGGRGQIGSTLVFGSWKGRSYARAYVIPSNPNTSEQQLTRNAFAFLQGAYKVAPALVTAPWEAYAKGKVLTARNAWTSFNNATLRTASDLSDFVMSPGALGGLPPTALVVTPGAGQLTLDITAPAVAPQDWTLQAAIGAVIEDQDPQTGEAYTITAGEDTTSTYSVILTGLDAVLHQAFAWLRWVRPDGLIAYSPSIQSSGTPS